MNPMRNNYGWLMVGDLQVPYIFRVVNGWDVGYVCEQMAERVLLSRLLRGVHSPLVRCARIPSYRVTQAERELLNDIMTRQENAGRLVRRDVRVEVNRLVEMNDLIAVHSFLSETYFRLHQQYMGRMSIQFFRYGFVRGTLLGQPSRTFVVPYTVEDDVRYVPTSFSRVAVGEQLVRTIDGWASRRLHACLAIMGIRVDRNRVQGNPVNIECMRLVDLKHMNEDVTFEDFWPEEQISEEFRVGGPKRWTWLSD